MKFINVPKIAVEFLDFYYSDYVLISITETEYEREDLKISKLCKDVLYLHFHDTDHENEGLILFSRDQAKEILEFYHKYKNKSDNIIIHCTAGISRSAGVAAALYRIHFGEDDNIYWDKYIPNMLVYKTLLREYYGLRDDEFI